MGQTLSVVDQLLRERDDLVRRIRILALGLDLVGEVSQMLLEHTGIRGPMEMHETDDLRWMYTELAKAIYPERYEIHGEASFDLIRRATPDMLRAVAMLSDQTMHEHKDEPRKTDCTWLHANLVSRICRDELERRGIPE